MKLNYNKAQWGWIGYDWSNSAFVLCVITVLGPAYFIHLFQEVANEYQVFIGPAMAMPVAGMLVTAEAMWSWGVGISAAIVAFSTPFIGNWADRQGLRKRVWVFYFAMGVITTMALGFDWPWWMVGLWMIAGNIGYEGGNVYYNALLNDVAPQHRHQSLSARGYAAGYVGGVVVLLICLYAFVPPAGSLQQAFILVGLWWGGFGLLSLYPIVEGAAAKHSIQSAQAAKPVGEWGQSWQTLKSTLKQLPKRPHTARFLLSFLLYNDGVATLISNATPYALQNITMDSAQNQPITIQALIGVIILIQVVAAPGAMLGSWLSPRFGDKRVLMAAIVVFIAVSVLGQYANVLNHLYGLAVLIGLVLGSTQSISRAMFASFIPKGCTAEYFALFGWSAKFSAMLGPLVYAALLLWTGSTRLALLSLSVFFAAGWLLLWTVNPTQARKEAGL